ncbi:MAG: hypothetical protein WC408_01225 [Candidatus Micrarchaeia archaeon]
MFVVCLTFILSFWSMTITSRAEMVKRSRLEYSAIAASDVLIKSSGTPSNWEDNITGLKMIGLASSPNVLSLNKLSNFSALDYSIQKTMIGIDLEYYFYLEYANGTKIFSNGNSSLSGSQITVIRRIALLGNETVSMVLFAYG